MKPILGHTRTGECSRTIGVFLGKIQQVSQLHGHRLLDVGCGDGTFTIELGRRYDEVYGIDVQQQNVKAFATRTQGDGRFHAMLMSATALHFPDSYFDTIVSLETFEHIDNVSAAARECWRVLKPKGEMIVSVPNRWFPCENHGGRCFGREFTRLPLITYSPWLHSRFANARVFTVRSLDNLFIPSGFRRTNTAWLWPTFEHSGNPLQRVMKPLFSGMRWMENGPLTFFGTSILARYIKIKNI